MTAAADRERLALLVHEVRSPVAAIAAISEALSDDRLEESAMRELLGLAVAACRGIERVVGDAALGSIHVQAMDPGRLVRDAVSAAALGGARVRAEIQTGLPQLDADPQRLRQALDNLIANALIHSSSKDEVVVRAGADDQTVFLTVSDTGKGIPLGEQSRIFDPGVRLDNRSRGSGLGLAIVRAIAEAHGAALSVESEPGEGATFTIVLPIPA